MNAYSTIFFVDGSPVGYTVAPQQENRLELNPAENPMRSIKAPRITAELVKGEWQVQGNHNPQLVRQVLEELNRNKNLLARRFTAAPY